VEQLEKNDCTEDDETMKVWLDMLTPKQANFLGELHHRLIGRGFKTLLTTREYREVNQLLDLKGLKALRVGRHGGGDVKEKLLESSKRISSLVEIVEDQKPDVAVSFSSPEAARVAFGLKIPHYCVSDSPHAEAVCRLTVPLSQKLFTPWLIPVHVWTRFGIGPRDVVRYHGLDPAVWLTDKSSSKTVDGLKLDAKKPIILIRTPEEYASYLSDRSTSISTKVADIVEKALTIGEDNSQIVILPRYDAQGERLRKRFGNRVVVPDHLVDAIPLMRQSSVFLGGGGTMTAEAALLGLPVISYYPGDPTFVERFLINYGLVERVLDPDRIAQRAIAITKSEDFREYYQKKANRLLRSMEDPLRVITNRIFKH
jgi:predicted glycosyltransferase